MGDFSSTGLSAFVEGLITIVAAAPAFQGRGVSAIVRTAGGAALGDFTLTLDQPLPGSLAAAEAAPAPAGVSGSVIGNPRAVVTLRGSATNALVGAADAFVPAVSYNVTANLGVTSIRLVLAVAGAGVDPTGSHANGCEFSVLKSVS